MPFLEIPERHGLRICYYVNELSRRGDDPPHPLDPAKPNVILLHATTSASALSFSAQFSDPRLTRAFNLIALDGRFHGFSEGDHLSSHSIEDSADCVIAALDKLELESYNIVGEGFQGSNIACWIAIKRPQKVLAICLVSPGPFREEPETIAAIADEWLPETVANKDGNGDGTGAISDATAQSISDYLFGDVIYFQEERRVAFMKAFQARYGEGNLSSHDLSHIVNCLRRDPIPAQLLASIKVPCLIIHGDADKHASPLSAAEAWQKSLTSARGGADLRRISGAPHLLLYTDYSIANRFMLAFFQRN